MTERTFIVTIKTNTLEPEEAFDGRVSMDYSEDSLFMLLRGLLEYTAGVEVTDVVEQQPIP